MGRSGMADPGGIDPGGIIVADGQNQRFWRACAAYQKSGDRTHPPVQQISCTLDGSATWRTLVATIATTWTRLRWRATARSWRLRHNPFASARLPRHLLRVTPGQSAWESLGALPVRDAPLGALCGRRDAVAAQATR